MMCLKYPEPGELTEEQHGGGVFFLPPQGMPGVTAVTRSHLLLLRSHLRRHLGTIHRVECQPQRVGLSSSVAVRVEGQKGEVHLLLTVGGHVCWPSEEEYVHPRWYIQVVDAVDLFYLLLWLSTPDKEDKNHDGENRQTSV